MPTIAHFVQRHALAAVTVAGSCFFFDLCMTDSKPVPWSMSVLGHASVFGGRGVQAFLHLASSLRIITSSAKPNVFPNKPRVPPFYSLRPPHVTQLKEQQKLTKLMLHLFVISKFSKFLIQDFLLGKERIKVVYLASHPR